MKRKNRQLGMDRDIARRDFLNGISISAAVQLRHDPKPAKPVEVTDMQGAQV